VTSEGRREPEAAAADGGGPAAFRDWLDAGGAGEPPRRLLDDPAASEAVHPVIEIEERAFASRYELGGFLVGLLEPLDVASARFDGGLWDLLSLQVD
jgi:hypothetical protein